MDTDTTAEPTRRIELWIRPNPDAEHDLYDDAVSRLAGLALRGLVDDFAVETWGKQVAVSADRHTDEHSQRIRDRVTLFERWTDTHDVDVPEFDERTTVGEGRMGAEYEVQSLPAAGLAEFEGDELLLFTPSSVGPERVRERIDALAHGEAEFGVPQA
jgi:hypothetical protein